MKTAHNSDPSSNKGNRKVRNAVRATAAVAALALAGCGVGHTEAKAHWATTAPASAPAKSNVSPKTSGEVAFEQAREAQIEEVKLTAINAANKLIDGLTKPEVGAENYAADVPYLYGNAYNSGGTKKPETFARLLPDTNTIVIASLSESGNTANSPYINLAFKISNPSGITSQGKLTPDGLRAAFSNPANLQLVGADAGTSMDKGAGIAWFGNDLDSFAGIGSYDSANDPLYKPGEPGYGLRGTPITTNAQLTAATTSLNKQLIAASDQLSQQF